MSQVIAKTSITTVRKIISDIRKRYPSQGSFIRMGGGDLHVIVNSVDDTKGATLRLDSFQGFYSLDVREWYRCTTRNKPDVKDTRTAHYSITCANYLKIQTLLTDTFNKE